MEYIEKNTDISKILKDIQSRKLYCWAARRAWILIPIYIVCVMMLFTQLKGLYLAWIVHGKLYNVHIIDYVILPIVLYAATYFLPYAMFKANMKRARKIYGNNYVLKLQNEGYSINNVIIPWNKAKKSVQCRYGIAQMSNMGPTLMITVNSISNEEYKKVKSWMNLK